MFPLTAVSLKSLRFAILVALLLFGSIPPMPVSATHSFPVDNDFVEGFEDYAAGYIPAWPDGNAHNYDYRSGNVVTNEQAHTGSNSLRWSNAESVELDYRRQLCGTSIDFWWRINTALGAQTAMLGTGRENGARNIGGMRVTATEVAVFASNNAGTNVFGTAVPGFTPVVDTWYHAILSVAPCGMNACHSVLAIVGVGTSAFPSPSDDTCQLAVVDKTCEEADGMFCQLESGGSQPYTGWIDDLKVSGIVDTVAPTASVTVSNLVGADVDPYSQVITWREASGGLFRVHSIDPISLLDRQPGSPADSGCNRAQGLFTYVRAPAAPQYIGYARCTDTATETNAFAIRGGDLGDPDQSGTVCTDFCDDDNDAFTDFNEEDQDIGGFQICNGVTGDENSFPDDLYSMGSVHAVPLSFTTGENPSGSSPKRVQVGFVANNANTIVAYVWNLINVNDDFTCKATAPFGAIADQICTWRAPDGNDYVAAVSNAAQTKIWRIEVDPIQDESGPRSPTMLHSSGVRLFGQQGLTGSYERLLSIECAGTEGLVMTNAGNVARVRLVGNGTGTASWVKTGCSVIARGVAFSNDQKWGACYAGANILVFNATSGATVSTITTPAGAFNELEISDTGQTLWVFTATTIARYDIYPTTTGVEVPDGRRSGGACVDIVNSPCGETPGTPSPTDQPGVGGGLFGDVVAANADALGSETAAGFYIALLIVVSIAVAMPVAVGAGAKQLGVKMPAVAFMGLAGGGAGLGTVASWAFDLIPTEVLFIIVIVVLGLAGGGIWYARRGG